MVFISQQLIHADSDSVKELSTMVAISHMEVPLRYQLYRLAKEKIS